jgi:catechol 2,3-dioxygenase-like lactoylglutathione lyase family enzyme
MTMGVIAGHVMHLNLNTADLEAERRFYDALLGLHLRMKSGGDGGDWTFHGIAEPVSSMAWFLYDDRGPRSSPALEMIEWRAPATAGSAYPQFVHRGMTSVRFGVPTLDGLAAVAAGAGGTVVGPLGADGLLVRDTDGVHLELIRDDSPHAPDGPRLLGARIGCADLDASLAWYARLGFEASAPAEEHTLDVAGSPTRFRSATVALPSRTAHFELTQWLDPIADEPAEARLWYRGMVRMAISVEDLDDAMDALRATGYACPAPQYFDMPGTAIGGLRVLFLSDPDGFTVELVHRPARHFQA